MNRWLKIALIGLAIVLVVLGTAVFMFFKPMVMPEDASLQNVPLALLAVQNGAVDINKGDGWVPGKKGAALEMGWRIRTENESSAEIAFFADSVARLDANTEVKIMSMDGGEKFLYLQQVEGDVWYDILDTSGITYLIETPDGNFTNEGTSFGCSVTRAIATPISGALINVPSGSLTRAAVGAVRPIGTTITVSRGSVVQIPAVTIPTTRIPTTTVPTSRIPTPGINVGSTISGAGSTTDSSTTGISIGTTVRITANPSSGYTFTTNAATNTVTMTPCTATDNTFVQQNTIKNERTIANKREQIKTKYKMNIGIGKGAYKQVTGKEITNAEIDKGIDSVLKGETDVSKMVKDGTIPSHYVFLIPTELMKPVTGTGAAVTKPAGGSGLTVPVKVRVGETFQSGCKEGDWMSEPVTTYGVAKTVFGVDGLRITDWKGTRGLSSSAQKDVIGNIETGLTVIDYVGKAADLFDLATAGSDLLQTVAGKVFDQTYGIGAGGAQDAILNKLKEWENKRAFAGLPLWIKVAHGEVWKQLITPFRVDQKKYKCESGVWKYVLTEKGTDQFMKGVCRTVKPAGEYTHNSDYVRLLQESTNYKDDCGAGSCAQIWATEFPKALSATMRSLGVTAVGKCTYT